MGVALILSAAISLLAVFGLISPQAAGLGIFCGLLAVMIGIGLWED